MYNIINIYELINKKSTSVFRKIRDIGKNLDDDISNYDISNFKYDLSNNHFIIKPDSNFIELYHKYCLKNNFKKLEDLTFVVSVLPKSLSGEYNLIDVEDLIPDELKGLSIGYKIYKFVLDKSKFLMTNKNNSPEAKNLWYNLLKDDDMYAGTNKYYNIIIKKDISDELLISILNKVKKFSFIFDDELNNKIDKLNGK